MNGQPDASQAEGWLADIAEDVRDTIAILDRLAGMIDGSALSLLRVHDAIDQLSWDDRDYIVWIAAIERYARRAPEWPMPFADVRRPQDAD